MGFKCCNGCTKRWVDFETGKNCHTSCPEYLKELEEHRKEEERRKAVNSSYDTIRDYYYGTVQGRRDKALVRCGINKVSRYS